jgi:hypothetical protein
VRTLRVALWCERTRASWDRFWSLVGTGVARQEEAERETAPMQKGSIHLTMLSRDPEHYLATFQVMDGTLRGPVTRTFTDVGELDKFLRYVEIPSDRIRTAFRDTRRGNMASIPDVVMCDGELEDFVLVEQFNLRKTG